MDLVFYASFTNSSMRNAQTLQCNKLATVNSEQIAKLSDNFFLKKAEKDSVRLCKIGQYRRLSNPCTLPNSSLTAIEKTLKNFPICHNFLSHHLIV